MNNTISGQKNPLDIPMRESALSAAERLLKNLDDKSAKVSDFIELVKIVNDQEVELVHRSGEELLYELFCDWRVSGGY